MTGDSAAPVKFHSEVAIQNPIWQLQFFTRCGGKTSYYLVNSSLVCAYHYIANIPRHGPLARYAKLQVAHAPGIPGTFSPSLRVSDPDMHHGMCVTHIPRCMPGSLTNGFL